MKTRILLVMLLGLPLAACNSWQTPEDQPSADAGQAVRQNITAQIANPKAPQGVEPQALNGERAALAIDRYAKGQTIPPEDMDQSKSGKGGGDGANASH
jgi:type IV pilus biogenesis protein CpaD/CtpE